MSLEINIYREKNTSGKEEYHFSDYLWRKCFFSGQKDYCIIPRKRNCNNSRNSLYRGHGLAHVNIKQYVYITYTKWKQYFCAPSLKNVVSMRV